MADYTDSLAAEDVPFERLDAAEIRQRWPQWHVDDDVTSHCGRRAVASPTRSTAMPLTGGSHRATARRCATGRR